MTERAVTLMGSRIANPGRLFVFTGPLDECKQCPVNGVCFNLTPGIPHEIMALRGKQHDCFIHEGGQVEVIEVEPRPLALAIESRLAEGTSAPFSNRGCPVRGCAHFALCHPPALPSVQIRVVKTGARLDCAVGLSLVEAECEIVPPTES